MHTIIFSGKIPADNVPAHGKRSPTAFNKPECIMKKLLEGKTTLEEDLRVTWTHT
jgi:hypothetical protein